MTFINGIPCNSSLDVVIKTMDGLGSQLTAKYTDFYVKLVS